MRQTPVQIIEIPQYPCFRSLRLQVTKHHYKEDHHPEQHRTYWGVINSTMCHSKSGYSVQEQEGKEEPEVPSFCLHDVSPCSNVDLRAKRTEALIGWVFELLWNLWNILVVR